GAGEQLFGDAIPTSLGPGESRELTIRWNVDLKVLDQLPQLRGLLHYYDIAGALWQTRFRIEAEQGRWLLEVQETEMLSPPDGEGKNGTAGEVPRRYPSVPFPRWKLRQDKQQR